jgi:GNAT superfamily N-acetyltransferase
VGFLFCKVISTLWDMLDGFYVLPRCRGKGVGKRLLEELEWHARIKGITYISSMVDVYDGELAKYVEKRGFKKAKTYHWFEWFLE